MVYMSHLAVRQRWDKVGQEGQMRNADFGMWNGRRLLNRDERDDFPRGPCGLCSEEDLARKDAKWQRKGSENSPLSKGSSMTNANSPQS